MKNATDAARLSDRMSLRFVFMIAPIKVKTNDSPVGREKRFNYAIVIMLSSLAPSVRASRAKSRTNHPSTLRFLPVATGYAPFAPRARFERAAYCLGAIRAPTL